MFLIRYTGGGQARLMACFLLTMRRTRPGGSAGERSPGVGNGRPVQRTRTMEGKQIVYLRSGMTARVYQAKSQLWCDICGRSIDAGAYFSRHRLSASGMVQV